MCFRTSGKASKARQKIPYKMAGKEALKIVMYLGSNRNPRMCSRVAKFVQTALVKTGHEVTIFDPWEMELPMLKTPFFMVQDSSTLPDSLVKAQEALAKSDGIVVVSGEYNHSIPPALSNLIDHFSLKSYAYKPSAIVCYSPGPYGGMRAAMQLRAMLGEIGTVSIPYIFGIPHVGKALGEEGEPLNDHMESSVGKLITQLDWYAEAIRTRKTEHGTP
eukprot:m.308384 g.308384  ORF g.308384 m.308384 type:complete len:218 (+) comp43910_c0_seq1:481-1134(+)